MKFSQFANRFQPDSGILRLMEDLGEALDHNTHNTHNTPNTGRNDSAADAHTGIQMLGGGNPASIPEVEAVLRAEMESMLADGGKFERMVGDYDGPQGNRGFIEELAALLSQHFGWPLDARHIAVTNGSQAGFGVLFNLFSGRYAGGGVKKILLPMTPEYIGYADVGLGAGPAFTANKPVIESIDELIFKYRVDFERLRLNANIGAVCISRPTNPTGNVVTDGELAKLRRLTREAGVPLIVDGAYGPPFPGIVFNRARPVWDENMILCLSLSKLGLPGARTGIIIANPEVIRQVTASNAIFTLAPGRFGPSLVTRLLASRELLALCADKITPYYRKRSRHALHLVRELMADLPVRAHSSEGAIFLWLWFPGMPVSCETLYQRLKARGVLVIAGQHFFPGLAQRWRHRHECIRVTYATEPAQLERGMAVIAEEVRRAYSRGC